ncbi:LLM class flavin-dependent oxidoreductase [Cereibacter sphaeroides]|uniref:LLM class flavin-dependent oxidoreductase n=1 Tax=Cereibacter sphaeroides TaxID=1063 RepID=UPI001F2B9230|nr:LLM class flavin-dependent oxidoreductase [Cereibacter sphaeroides]MCE6960315.1 LLM class flavin-dependent oxidoreductase [Cereibacter sphaeroides]MCE6969264.1 LLM class flavin-dependent oxidoreductase [Cereibacter sphaeroides]MCE6975323.1 LLM class flavin-dependent oxidoreductase [Cereibacter sphaeroides]
MTLEFGLDTFGDVTWDADRRLLSQREVLRNVVEEAVLADEVGVDAIGLGEHHRDDFAISAPEILLAAIGARTRRIRLGTAVTVLGSDDPVRLFQRFSTLDAITDGRAEVTLGRGSFTESFPLFGHDLSDYATLFEEKLELFSRLLREPEVSWSGTMRPALVRQRVWPPLGPDGLRAWIGVGGSPESVVRAVRFRMPMILAIIGGAPGRFLPFADLYRRASAQAGLEPMPLGVHSPGHIAPTDAQAREEAFPAYKALHDRLGAERGWPRLGRDDFLREVEHGSMYVGSPATVARKIAQTVRTLDLARFQLKYSMGPLAHGALMRSVELFGREVIPMVRDILGRG